MNARRAAWAVGIAGALVKSAVAGAEVGPPPWLDHAKQSVAFVRVPPREGVPQPQLGTAFVVGYDAANLYLVTAAHVVWPIGSPEADEVSLSVDLRALHCQEELPASARKKRRSPPFELDLAVLVVPVAQLGESEELRACPDLMGRVRRLPRNILEPRHQAIAAGTAWIIGRGGSAGGMEAPVVTLGGAQDVTGRIMLSGAGEVLKGGYSGSPLFSAEGHLLGMIVKNDPDDAATKFSAVLDKLKAWGDVPTNLAGDYSFLTFRHVKEAEIVLAGWPVAPLTIPHPAPHGEGVDLALNVRGRPAVATTLNVTGNMVCDVNWVGTIEAFAARHRKATLGIALGLTAVGVAATVGSRNARDSFNASPSSSSYDQVQGYNGVALGAYGAAIAVGGFSGYGFWRSGRVPGIACQRAK